MPETCFIKKKIGYTGSIFDYYANTQAFYTNVAVGAGLDASLESSFSLGFTLSSVAEEVDSKESTVSGVSLNIRALTEKILVKIDCLDETAKLTQYFINDFKLLPVKFEKPWLRNSWKDYDIFLDKYGSHVITSVSRGASIKQTTFAKSSNSYSERDFQVKSCVSFAGPTTVGKVGVKACANVSKTEISKATHMNIAFDACYAGYMNTEDKLIIRGGTVNTRSALRTSRTKELIEQFLNEAKDSNEGVQHTFKSIWNLLQDRFEFGSDSYIRAVNLQYYYLGFLNYGCSFEESGGVSIQKFDYSKESTKESPEFECTLAAEGCHSSNDCHYKPVWCSCYGPSCVKYETVKQDTCGRKISAVANYNEYWGWHGCGWQVAGSYCNCYNGNKGSRRTVWTLPSRDAVRGGSAQSAAQHKSDNQDKSQEVEDRGENTADPSKESPGSSGDASGSGWDARWDLTG